MSKTKPAAKLAKLPKPKRMFVMVEVDSTGLTAKDVRTAVLSRMQGHPLVRVLQVDVNVARAMRPADLLPVSPPAAWPSPVPNNGDGDAS